MDGYRTKEELFDAICREEFLRYIKKESESYPSKEELDAMYTVSKRGRRRLMRAIKAERYGKPLLAVYLQRVAIILLVTITVAFGVLMTNTEVRAAIGKVFIEWYEKYVKFDFNGGEGVNIKIEDTKENSNENSGENTEPAFESNPLYDYEIGYIPEGYELESSREIDYMRDYIYFNSEGSCVDIMISHINNISISFDIENHEYTETEINGKPVYLLYSDSIGDGTIICNESDYIISVYGTVKKEELIKIFENIKNN